MRDAAGAESGSAIPFPNDQLRIAVFGLSGAGKSTTSRLLLAEIERLGFGVKVVKIAQPLYDVQRLIYSLCGCPLVDPYEQDGALLRSLADNFRRINPQSLLADFERRVVRSRETGIDVLICDDMRLPDLEGVLGLGFKTIRVRAPDAVRSERRSRRGDLTPISDAHAAEAEISVAAHYEIDNSGDIGMLSQKLRAMLAQLWADSGLTGHIDKG